MSRFPRLLSLLAVALLAGPSLAADGPKKSDEHADCNILLYTDAKPEADNPKYKPSKDHPVYYLALARGDGKFHPLGHPLGNPRDEAIRPQDVFASLEPQLLAQGYRNVLRFQPKAHAPRPTLILMFEYGSMTPETISGKLVQDDPGFGAAALENIQDGVDPHAVLNAGPLGEIVGLQSVSMNDFDFERIKATIEDNRYYVTVTAFDFESADAPGKRKLLLWRARMSTFSGGTDLAASLKPLFSAGAAYFGKNSRRPRSVDIRQGKVEIGETKVVPEPPPAAK